MTEREAYDELCAYRLNRGDAEFIHQHVVDAFAAQSAGDHTKPITLAFALAGLLLHVELGLTGREVQRAHMQMARRRRAWPPFELPAERGVITAAHVVAREPGAARDGAIHAWAAAVWAAFRSNKGAIEELLSECNLAHHRRSRPATDVAWADPEQGAARL